jgi:hypothetical protein
LYFYLLTCQLFTRVTDEVDNAMPKVTNEQPPLLKLLCGADLLESFGTPGLWADEDVSVTDKHSPTHQMRVEFSLGE